MSDSCHLADPGDPDVAGLGVTISFFATVCLTGAVILTLYFREDIFQCNAVDIAIIRYFRKPFRKTAAMHEEDEDSSERFTIPKTTMAKRKTILMFLRTLSDQQLFTGLSLSLVTYIKLADRDNFSAYSFKMATTTIWLSCLTHISTVLTLSEDPSFLTGYRVAAILLLFLLLAPILVLSNLPMFILDPSLSFQCAWDKISSYDREATLNFSFTAALALMMVISGYSRAFNLLNAEYTTSSWLARFVLIKLPSLDSYRKFELALWIEDKKDNHQQPQHYPVSWRILCLELLRELRRSFFWQIMWLVFYYTYGISSLAVAWSLLPPVEQWSLSYGQLLPIVMFVFVFQPLYDGLQAPPETTEQAESHSYEEDDNDDDDDDDDDSSGNVDNELISHDSYEAQEATKTSGNEGKKASHEAEEPDNKHDAGIEAASYGSREGQVAKKSNDPEKDAGYQEATQSKDMTERRDMPDHTTNKNQVALQSESQEADGIDVIEPAGRSPSRRSSLIDRPRYSSWPTELNEYRATSLRREAFNAHKGDHGFSQWVPAKVYDPQYMKFIGRKLSPTVDIAFKLSKARTITCLLVAGSVVFVWQQFLALLIGGAFYKLMAGTQPWVWTGVIIFLSVPASIQTVSMVQTSYNMVFDAISAMAVDARRSMMHERDEAWSSPRAIQVMRLPMFTSSSNAEEG